MNCASYRGWLFEIEPEAELLLGVAAFGEDCQRVGFAAILVLWKLGHPNKGIVREKKRLYTKHKSLRIHLFFFVSCPNSGQRWAPSSFLRYEPFERDLGCKAWCRYADGPEKA